MKKITLKRAGELLGINPYLLGNFLKNNKLPEIGCAIKSKKYYSYLIFEEDVNNYINKNGK